MPAAQTAQTLPLPDAAAIAANLIEAQKRGAATFARAYDVFTQTAQAVWEKEPELFRLEADQLLKSFSPPKTKGETPADTMRAQYECLHANADQVIASLRHINDLTWDCSWRIAAIYAEGLQDMWKQAMPPAAKTPAKAA
jgi:hypothetical protein